MGINRNIVECKYSFPDCPLVPLLVLIETLWNVNQLEEKTDVPKRSVLIETLWNVNKVGALIIFRNGSRINRNIVECK